MSRDPLFDDRDGDDDYRRADETTYAFLDRTSRAEFAAPRGTLNEWFERWPSEDREQLRARLMGKKSSDFDGAFWELYLHEVHARLGFTIAREPEVAGVTTRPDFLMQRDDGAFYVEATVVGPSDREVADRQREQAVIDLINAAYHPDLSIRLHSVAVGPRQPAKRRVVAAVDAWLRSLDWATERPHVTETRPDPHHIEVDGTHLFVSPYARDPQGRGDRSFPTVVMGPMRGGFLNEPPSILADLRAKASKFGRLDKPYVIAVLCQRNFVGELDVEQALFGPEVVSIPVGPDGAAGDARLSREPHGFWQHDERKQATRVSAVLSAIHLHAWSIGDVPLRLWHNPWAKLPLQVALPWAAVEPNLATNQLVRRDAP